MARRNDTPIETPQLPERAEQPNGGWIYRGGVPGNKGGGRPKSEIKKAARLAFEQRISVLEELADDAKGRGSDRIGALRLLAAVGDLDTETPIDRELIRELAAAVHAELPEIEDRDGILERIFKRWGKTLGRKVAGG